MNTDKKIKETIAEIQANQELIENYESSNTDESLSDLEFKDNRLKGKVEGFKEVEQHTANQVVAISEGEQDEKQPFDFQAASQKMFRVKNELLDEFERLHNNGADGDTLNELRTAIETINGKTEALKEMHEAEAADQRSKAYKENRSFDTAPAIHTKTKSLHKSKEINMTGTEQKIYNSSEKVHTERQGEIGASEVLSAYLSKPKNDNQRHAIQNNLTSSGIELTDHLYEEVVDMFRVQNALINAGAKTIMPEAKGGAHKYVTVEGNIEGDYYPELGEAPISDATVFGTAVIEFSTYRFNVQISREAAEDSLNIGNAVLTAATGSVSDSMVKGAFVSQGSDAPVGLNDMITQTETFTNGGNASIMNLVNASKQLYDNNVPGEKQSAILSPSAWQAMQLEADANDRYQAQPPAIANMPKIVSSGVPAGEAYVGDFSSVLFGFGSSLILENYSGVSARKFAVEMLAAMRWDVTVLRPKGLVRIEEASV